MAPLPSHPAGPAAGRFSWRLCVVVTLLAALLPAVLWPGDTPWTNDEPLLIASALRANRAHRLAGVGLTGNMQVPYGPLPTQVYQAILLCTHDPLLLVAIRAALCSGLTALALLWLARTLRFNPWFAAAVVLAPEVYLFNRILWDATFIVPLGTLALAAFASFLHTASRRSLLTTCACTASLPLIHPQTLPLSIALGGYLLWRHRPTLRRHWAGLIIVALVLLVLNASYFAYLTAALLHVPRLAKSGYGGGRLPPPWAALTALRGGEFLGDDPLSAGIGRVGAVAPVVRAAAWLSGGVEVLVWAGMLIAAWQAFGQLRGVGSVGSERSNPPTGDDIPPDVRVTRRRVLNVALAAQLMIVALYAIIGVPPMVSYFFGPFPLTVLFAWVALEWLGRLRLGQPRRFLRLDGPVIALYGLCLAVTTGAGIWQIHRFGWPRDFPYLNLGNQLTVVRGLSHYSDASVLTNVKIYQEYPQALRTLRQLLATEDSPVRRPHSGRLFIRYRSELGPQDGRIELVDLPEGEAPADAKIIELTEAD